MAAEHLDLAPFETLLREAIGLDPVIVGRDEIRRLIEGRLAATSSRPEAYLSRLASDTVERDALIESLLVPETWFFREPTAFATLRELAQRADGERRRSLRVLSFPCATGEEPYSIAMTLLDAGRTAEDALVHAADLSVRALETARGGTYDGRAVRHVDEATRRRWFDAVGDRFRVRQEVRQLVTFARANLVDPEVFAGHAPYHVIFCRNVLIYFDAAARARTLATLARLLTADGLLVTGHAEGQRVVAPRFVFAGLPGTFAYRHAATAEASARPGPIARTARARAGDERAPGGRPRQPGGPSGPVSVPGERVPAVMEADEERVTAPDPAPAERDTADPGRDAVLLVRAGGELVGLPLAIVQRVYEHRPIRRIPHVRDPIVLGLTSLDRDLHVCVSIEAVLGHPAPDVRRAWPPRARLVAVGQGRIEWVMPVDEILGLPTVRPEAIEPPPATIGHQDGPIVRGLVPVGNERAGLLDGDRLMDVLRRRVA